MDPDDHLTPAERTRRALHRAVDRIGVGWPHALVDAGSRGYPGGVDYSSMGAGSELTSVENAAAHPDKAAAWLAELNRIISRLCDIHLDDSPGELIRGLICMLLHRRVDQLRHEPTIGRVIRLGNLAAAYWPTTAAGDTIGGVTVGRRGNLVEECGLCGQPVIGGAADPIRRIDGQAFHRTPCWYTATVARARTPQRHPPQQGAA